MKFIKTILISITTTLLVSACGPNVKTVYVKSGVIGTEGVIIRDENGTFEWRSGEVFYPPERIQTISYYGIPSADNVSRYYVDNCCVRVRIKIPGYKNEFYGVLRLSVVPEGAAGPGARSYYIQIPENYVQQATDGRISVVYELVSDPNQDLDDLITWVLYFSDMPIHTN